MPHIPFDPLAKNTEKARAEIEQDMRAYNAYIEKHGSPAEMMRDYLADRDDSAWYGPRSQT